jgi:hypothetical protein
MSTVINPDPFEMRVASLARETKARGYTLIQHLHFSLFKDGTQVIGPLESLDSIDGYLGVNTARPGATGGPLTRQG